MFLGHCHKSGRPVIFTACCWPFIQNFKLFQQFWSFGHHEWTSFLTLDVPLDGVCSADSFSYRFWSVCNKSCKLFLLWMSWLSHWWWLIPFPLQLQMTPPHDYGEQLLSHHPALCWLSIHPAKFGFPLSSFSFDLHTFLSFLSVHVTFITQFVSTSTGFNNLHDDRPLRKFALPKPGAASLVAGQLLP